MDEGIALEPQSGAQQWVFWTQHRGQCQPELRRLKGQFAFTLWWVVAGCWGSGFRGQTPRRGLVLTDLEDTLRGLVWQNWEGPGRSLGLPTIKEIIATRTLKIHRLKDPAFTSTVSRMSCSHGLQSQRETDWLGPAKTVMSTRGGASGNCSLQFQRGNAGLLATTKACVSARGGEQDPAMILTSKFATTKKLWVGTDHCPHLLDSLCILSRWRDPLHGANSPGGAHDLIQTVASSSRLQLQQTLPHTPMGLPCLYLLPAQLNKWALLSCYFHLLLSGQGTEPEGIL